MSRSTIKNIATASVAAALSVAVGSAFAHTTLRDKHVEGVTAYNALQLGHGCEVPGSGAHRNVIGQSVVFPTLNPNVYRTDNNAPVLLEEVIEQGSIADLPQLVQDKNVFNKQREKINGDEQVAGFSSAYGGLHYTLRGVIPFRMSAVNFVAESCAKTLLVKVAIADICTRKFPPVAGTANLWIPNTTAKFPNAVDGIGAPATMTIARDLVANPMDASCGTGYDVVVSPSDEDIDANLEIPGFWPGTGF